ncbi:MAG: class I SAM-dependent methyltransferase, partial [Chloroflexota bacterium]
CYTQSHPDRLATLATLMGMRPPAIERGRILELGCASGGNLIPMAISLPSAALVGIDYSATQIAEGQSIIEALGLTNVALKHQNILEVGPELGHFDYIIAHGVYSWTPPAVRDQLLAICRQNLSANGVAYVSYNTYPGWHLLGMVREMLLYYTRAETDPHQRAAKARELLAFLAESVTAENSAYGTFLEAYTTLLQKQLAHAQPRDDSLLLHDELETYNDPVYFHQFAEHAARHGLQYLSEAELPAVMPTNFRPAVSQRLLSISKNLIELEQHIDFLRNTTFRKTLLCHQEVALNRTLKADPERMAAFFVASRAAPVSHTPDVLGTTVEQFRGPDGAILSTDHPVSKAALLYLNEHSPQAIPFAELVAQAGRRVYQEERPPAALLPDAQVLAANVLKAYSYSLNLVELHVYRPPFVLEVSERPVASSLARWQARQSGRVVNLRHERVHLDEVSRYLLPLLDGRRDRQALVERLDELRIGGVIGVQREGRAIVGNNEARRVLGQEIELNLNWLARAALLMA